MIHGLLHAELKVHQALSDFADYVEKQQAARRGYSDQESLITPSNRGRTPRAGNTTRESSVAPSDSGYSSQSTVTEDHAELDILDTLNLSETSAHVCLKELLLGAGADPEDTLAQLSNAVQSRLLEGHGEALFDLGQEDNGESMAFSKEHWDVALDRIRRAAALLKADCKILMTRNVGGEQEVGPLNDKDVSATGKIMIRQKPDTVEDVVETRIAVVGNGRSIAFHATGCD